MKSDQKGEHIITKSSRIMGMIPLENGKYYFKLSSESGDLIMYTQSPGQRIHWMMLISGFIEMQNPNSTKVSDMSLVSDTGNSVVESYGL